MNPPPIPLCVPSLGQAERDLLVACVDDNFVSSAGPFIAEFERNLAKKINVPHAVATSTGTAGLHLAMKVLGVGAGDLVAVSDFTFIASANAASYVGADLLLVDSETTSWNMNTELLHQAVSERARRGERIPKAIEVVHVLGHPADIEPLLDLRDRFNIRLIEDAAEALGATYRNDGRSVGTFGDVGIFSFNGNKILTTGGGGMLVSHDAALADHARHLTTQAKGATGHYYHDEVGFNYRMTNIAAALGVAQLGRLDDFVGHKRRIAAGYVEHLDPVRVGRPPTADFADPTHWLYTVTVDPAHRDAVIEGLHQAGIGARTVWPPLRTQPPYRDAEVLGYGVGQAVFDSALSLPSSVDLNDDQVRKVSAKVNELVRALAA